MSHLTHLERLDIGNNEFLELVSARAYNVSLMEVRFLCSACSKGGILLTTILLLWEVPDHHILQNLTSTDKLLCHVCSMG